MRAILFLSVIFLGLSTAGLSQSNQPGKSPTPTHPHRSRNPPRHNIAIVIETSASMNTLDEECNQSKLDCVLEGVRTLLSKLTPCATKLETCDPSDAVDEVSLFVFPNVISDNAVKDYDCSSQNPRTRPYSLPSPSAPTYEPLDSKGVPVTYRIVDFSTDYRATGSTDLNPDSDLVKAVGGKPGCPHLKAPGGAGSYLTPAIYAAQASLRAEEARRPGSRSAMILIGQGSSTARQFQMGTEATNSGIYPSWINQCEQAITAAQAATAAGTRVYSVAESALPLFDLATAYPLGPECTEDNSGKYKGYSSCMVMQHIASSAAYFFSTGGSWQRPTFPIHTPCVSPAHSYRDINRIFTLIAMSIDADRSPRKANQPAAKPANRPNSVTH
jgi:hypothetical protein